MMRTPRDIARESPATGLRNITVIALVTLLAMFASTTAAHADVGLGTADSFAVLAGQSVTNTGPTTITGDIGIHPGATDPPDNVSGSGSITLTGTLHDGDAVAEQAKAALVTAYDEAAGRAVTETIAPELAGEDLGPGVYESDGAGAFQLGSGGTLTLTGGADDVWIFQSGSELLFTSGSQVVLDGADPCNVFWQVTSSATLGTNSSVVGTILALTSISLQTGATLDGRALARNGSVTMDSNTITNEDCTEVGSTTTVIELGEEDGNGGSSSSSSSSSSSGNGDDDDDTAPVADEGTTSEATPVETPTRVDTGGGGTAPLTTQHGVVLLVLAAAGVGALVTLRRRVTNTS
jgi:uncharacterized membrane protein YgcG